MRKIETETYTLRLPKEVLEELETMRKQLGKNGSLAMPVFMRMVIQEGIEQYKKQLQKIVHQT